MVKTYDNLKDDDGNYIPNRTMLFIPTSKIKEDGIISEYVSGLAYVPETPGITFIVDDWIIPQIDKLKFEDGELKVKDGKNIEEPQKTEKELEREQLLKRLAELETE